ncbi:hypothetical protein SAMN04488514_106208 [Kriegella aquimaris]|uniref:Uncharacterized protein n=1 Tax=Kriegella aquimaris TaxID=192904 RepID=A0A1G9RMQ0_9FLAO|nr:hypothetical protein SAMN04488514_106208 [Kriegella aquimaris]
MISINIFSKEMIRTNLLYDYESEGYKFESCQNHLKQKVLMPVQHMDFFCFAEQQEAQSLL